MDTSKQNKKQLKVCHRLHYGITKYTDRDNRHVSGWGSLPMHNREKRNRPQHPTTDYEIKRHEKTNVHKEMELRKQWRMEGVQQQSNRAPPNNTRNICRSWKTNKISPETNNRRKANQIWQSEKSQQVWNKKTQNWKKIARKKFQAKNKITQRKGEPKYLYGQSTEQLRLKKPRK